mmetsp:Transcript_25959/g.41732  ORF Transcript_25959/g.41732 Transcript_25959/m.41732 type:complete len:409 (+) Transcript_25959:152-1378(+)
MVVGHGISFSKKLSRPSSANTTSGCEVAEKRTLGRSRQNTMSPQAEESLQGSIVVKKKMFEKMSKTAVRKADRARYRAKLVQDGNVEPSQGQTFLERRTIQSVTEPHYVRALEDLETFHGARISDRIPIPQLDEMLVRYLNKIYLDGDQANVADLTLAALGWRIPAYAREGKKVLVRTMQCLRGFRKMAPTHGKVAIPLMVAFGIARYMIEELNEDRAGLIFLLGTALYCRPCEIKTRRAKDFAKPQRDAGGTMGWSVRFHIQEEQKPSKAGQYDESISLDLPWHGSLNAALPRIIANTKPDDLVLQLKHHKSIEDVLQAAVDGLELQQKITMHLMRHTGPTFDFNMKFRTLDEIKRRGRWSADSSVRRYMKEGRVNEQIDRLSPHQRQYCMHSFKNFGSVLLKRLIF